MKKVTERSTTLHVPRTDVPRRDMKVFYNEAMQLNRDITVAFLKTIEDKTARVLLPLAGTGIRALRIAQETDLEGDIAVNDGRDHFPQYFAEQCTANNVNPERFDVTSEDARTWFHTKGSYNYAEIDPFGSPNMFLDAAVQQVRHKSWLAVTATDVAPLAGTYVNTCRRKYWATPVLNHAMHETGLRILIRKIQLVAMQHEKALTPIFSYYKDHYFKIIFYAEKSKNTCVDILKEHCGIPSCGSEAGPLWTGQLFDEDVVEKIRGHVAGWDETASFLDRIRGEAGIRSVGFYDVHVESGNVKLSAPPRIKDVVRTLENNGFAAARTHFSDTGVRSDASTDEFQRCLREAKKE